MKASWHSSSVRTLVFFPPLISSFQLGWNAVRTSPLPLTGRACPWPSCGRWARRPYSRALPRSAFTLDSPSAALAHHLQIAARLDPSLGSSSPLPQGERPAFAAYTKRASQAWLRGQLERLFPGSEVQEDVALPLASSTMHLDVFIPSQRLAFEYHGQQHYEDLVVFKAAPFNAEHDREKAEALESRRITLIEVPFWWKEDASALVSTIGRLRPDISAH